MQIRQATEADLPTILAIYNHEIATSTVAYTDQLQTLDYRRAWLEEKTAAGLPVFVLEDEDGVAGFGTYGQFRHFCGYRLCAEHSVYVAANKRRLGYGRKLLAKVIEAATAHGMHTMIAAIDSENAASIELHAGFGFVHVGRMPEVAFKFDRWLTLVLMQKRLDDRTAP
jgi:phosphinothricin acetyltransferase